MTTNYRLSEKALSSGYNLSPPEYDSATCHECGISEDYTELIDVYIPYADERHYCETCLDSSLDFTFCEWCNEWKNLDGDYCVGE